MDRNDLLALAERGPWRVVRRECGGDRIWDVYGDHISDYLATMNPSLPVSNRETAERICDEANKARALAQQEVNSGQG